MTLTQLIYVSRREAELTDPVLDAIVKRSSERNRARGVTGVLIASGAHLMQLLEGDAPVVDALYDRISADPRHGDVRQLLHKQVRARLYPEWGMKTFDPDADAVLDRGRMSRMIADLQARTNTRDLSVEARILLHDFRLQLNAARAA
jgi:hypothetical protein